MAPQNPLFVLIGLIIAFGSASVWVYILSTALRFLGIETDSSSGSRDRFLSDVSKWMAAFTLLVFVITVENRSLASIGFEFIPPLWILVGGSAGFVILLASDIVTDTVVTPILDHFELGDIEFGLEDLVELPLPQRALMSVTAGVTEQILFFGYPIERLSDVVGNVYLAAIAAVFFFGLAHYRFWGLGGTLQISTKAVFLAGLYLWYRNLYILILAHFLNDFFGTVIYPQFAGLQKQNEKNRTGSESPDSAMSSNID